MLPAVRTAVMATPVRAAARRQQLRQQGLEVRRVILSTPHTRAERRGEQGRGHVASCSLPPRGGGLGRGGDGWLGVNVAKGAPPLPNPSPARGEGLYAPPILTHPDL